MDKIASGFFEGKSALLDILEKCAEKEDSEYTFGVYSGMLVGLIDCIYSTAPSAVVAERMIDLSIQQGTEDAAKYLKSKAS